MAITLKKLNQQIIVITGASSGIGLVTALAAVEFGAHVVLVSRNEEALQEIEQKINLSGGKAAYVVADVGNRGEVEKVAKEAINQFGRIDTWINDAGVSIWGKLEEVSEEDSKKLFDTNFWGVVNGSLVALPYLKKQGGALINVGSVASDIALPLQGMYSASKHAVKGFTDALRIELEQEQAPVSVTLIKPSGINTPFTEHAKNYTDREPKLPPPVYRPEEVANAILYAATHVERDIYVGGGGKLMSSLNKRLPGVMDVVSRKVLAKGELKDEPVKYKFSALHNPGEDGKIEGNQPGNVRKTSYYMRSSLNPALTGLAIAAAGMATLAYIGRKALESNKERK
jgi:short-subunit dehydrogenase